MAAAATGDRPSVPWAKIIFFIRGSQNVWIWSATAAAGVFTGSSGVQPASTVTTFLFTDIEGSTRLLRDVGETYSDILDLHHKLLREVWIRHRGVEVNTEGDAFFVAFADAADALTAAVSCQLSAVSCHRAPAGYQHRLRSSARAQRLLRQHSAGECR